MVTRDNRTTDTSSVSVLPDGKAGMHGVQLSDLIDGQEVVATTGNLEVPVQHLCIDSRKVVPGSLFFAMGGQLTDGNFYVEEAIDRGASAVISETPVPAHSPVAHVQVSHVRNCLAEVSGKYNGFPDADLRITGVTGTNGKTTVTMLAKHLLGESEKTAVLGTVHYDLGGRIIPSTRTTPESHHISGMLAGARDAGCERAMMEVSSHGVCQQRIHGMSFETAVFLNLTPEHLDYHDGMEDYYAAKRAFMVGAQGNPPRHAVVNLDDAYGKRLFQELPEDSVKYGFGEDSGAHFRARHIQYASGETTFELEHPDGVVDVRSPLIGRFNIQNLLATLAIGWIEGQSMETMLDRLEHFKGSPGRLESVREGQAFNVFVDYAHTSDALKNLLSVLKEVTDGRLLLVFGCGGDRDQEKRPAMTRAAQQFCDFAWATADNPRSEPLDSIFEHMRVGVDRPERIQFVKDRRRAIGFAIEKAGPSDCVIIAGKGHEAYQEFDHIVVPFDDRRVARELLRLKKASAGELAQW